MRKAPLLIFLVSLLLFTLNSGSVSIFSLDEAKNASCSREMLERGDFIVPTFNYELRTDKPPVHYWFIALAYKIFGYGEFSARFFSGLFGSLTVLITFLFVKRYVDSNLALISTFILLSSIHFVLQFHMAVPDPYLIFFLTSAFYSFYAFYREGRELFLYTLFLSLGLAVLTKGLVGIVLPSMIIFTFLITQNKLLLLKKMKLHLGIVIVLGIALPWYLAVGIQTNWVWVEEFLFKHNISRFSEPMEGHGGIFLLTYIFVLLGMLPFSIFIPQVLKYAWKSREDSLVVYLSTIILIYTTFFAISKTKLPNYTVPVYPPLAVLIALYLQRLDIEKSKIIYNLIFFTLFSLTLSLGLYFLMENDRHLYMLKNFSLYFLILSLGGVLSIYFYMKRKLSNIITSLGISSILVSIVIYMVVLPALDRESSIKSILRKMDISKPVGYYKRYNPAFSFYIKKRIVALNSPQEVREFTKGEKVYILTRQEYLQEIEGLGLKVVAKKKDLFENPTSVLLTNRE